MEEGIDSHHHARTQTAFCDLPLRMLRLHTTSNFTTLMRSSISEQSEQRMEDDVVQTLGQIIHFRMCVLETADGVRIGLVGIKTRASPFSKRLCRRTKQLSFVLSLESTPDHEVTTVFSSMRCILVSLINLIKKIRLCKSTCPWIPLSSGLDHQMQPACTVWVG